MQYGANVLHILTFEVARAGAHKWVSCALWYRWVKSVGFVVLQCMCIKRYASDIWQRGIQLVFNASLICISAVPKTVVLLQHQLHNKAECNMPDDIGCANFIGPLMNNQCASLSLEVVQVCSQACKWCRWCAWLFRNLSIHMYWTARVNDARVSVMHTYACALWCLSIWRHTVRVHLFVCPYTWLHSLVSGWRIGSRRLHTSTSDYAYICLYKNMLIKHPFVKVACVFPACSSTFARHFVPSVDYCWKEALDARNWPASIDTMLVRYVFPWRWCVFVYTFISTLISGKRKLVFPPWCILEYQ